jgi:aldose 1-epimerase
MLDFSEMKRIGDSIEEVEGYDQNYVICSGNEPVPAAIVYSPVSGRTMEVITSEPGIQLYTGNHLNRSFTGKSGRPYQKYSGLCLETQHFPDSPNHSNFPNVFLHPNEVFKSTTSYRFGVK